MILYGALLILCICFVRTLAIVGKGLMLCSLNIQWMGIITEQKAISCHKCTHSALVGHMHMLYLHVLTR